MLEKSRGESRELVAGGVAEIAEQRELSDDRDVGAQRRRRRIFVVEVFTLRRGRLLETENVPLWPYPISKARLRSILVKSEILPMYCASTTSCWERGVQRDSRSLMTW